MQNGSIADDRDDRVHAGRDTFRRGETTERSRDRNLRGCIRHSAASNIRASLPRPNDLVAQRLFFQLAFSSFQFRLIRHLLIFFLLPGFPSLGRSLPLDLEFARLFVNIHCVSSAPYRPVSPDVRSRASTPAQRPATAASRAPSSLSRSIHTAHRGRPIQRATPAPYVPPGWRAERATHTSARASAPPETTAIRRAPRAGSRARWRGDAAPPRWRAAGIPFPDTPITISRRGDV